MNHKRSRPRWSRACHMCKAEKQMQKPLPRDLRKIDADHMGPHGTVKMLSERRRVDFQDVSRSAFDHIHQDLRSANA